MIDQYNPHIDPESLLGTNDHAKMRDCSPSTIRRERRERRGVPFVEINKNTIKYRRQDIIDYIRSQKRVEVKND